MRMLLSTAAVIGLAAFTLGAQAPPAAGGLAPQGLVAGSGNFFSPIVADLDKALAFYRDGLGLDVTGDPANADANPALRNMFGLPDAQIRWQIARPPAMRTGVEIVEIKKVPGRPAERRIQDPGAFMLIVLVRDLGATLARLKAVGAPVVSRDGAPMLFGKASGVVVRDPDGHFVELFQPDPLPEAAATTTANVLEVRVRLIVENAERAMRLYRDGLGLRQTSFVDFAGDPRVLGMLGLSKGQFRYGVTQTPGSGLTIEFMEFKDVDRRAVQAGIQDPGSTRMQLQVHDVDAAIAVLRKAGGTVVSTNGEPVLLPGRGGATTKVAIVRDPDNLFVVLLQAAR